MVAEQQHLRHSGISNATEVAQIFLLSQYSKQKSTIEEPQPTATIAHQ